MIRALKREDWADYTFFEREAMCLDIEFKSDSCGRVESCQLSLILLHNFRSVHIDKPLKPKQGRLSIRSDWTEIRASHTNQMDADVPL